MSILGSFKNMMSGSSPELPEQWYVPESPVEIDQLFNSENNELVILYKHSYRCSVCNFSKSRVEANIEEQSQKARFVFIDVIKNRSVSDRIAELSGISHQSPQLLIVQNGRVIQHASHGEISSDMIAETVAE